MTVTTRRNAMATLNWCVNNPEYTFKQIFEGWFDWDLYTMMAVRDEIYSYPMKDNDILSLVKLEEIEGNSIVSNEPHGLAQRVVYRTPDDRMITAHYIHNSAGESTHAYYTMKDQEGFYKWLKTEA